MAGKHVVEVHEAGALVAISRQPFSTGSKRPRPHGQAAAALKIRQALDRTVDPMPCSSGVSWATTPLVALGSAGRRLF